MISMNHRGAATILSSAPATWWTVWIPTILNILTVWDRKRDFFIIFETLYENLLAFDHYQTAGHLDYAARYIKKPVPEFHYEDYEDILDAILLHLIKKDKALEVNTSGLKAGLAWPNPHLEILKRYHDLGGRRLTIGSDAHQPEHMAYDFHILPDYLRQAGFDRYEIYRKQQAFEILL